MLEIIEIVVIVIMEDAGTIIITIKFRIQSIIIKINTMINHLKTKIEMVLR